MNALIMAIVAAVVYALAGLLKSNESFEAPKMVATLIIGVLVGAVLWVSGVQPTQENVYATLAAYTGLIALTEFVIKGIIRRIDKLAERVGEA